MSWRAGITKHRGCYFLKPRRKKSFQNVLCISTMAWETQNNKKRHSSVLSRPRYVLKPGLVDRRSLPSQRIHVHINKSLQDTPWVVQQRWEQRALMLWRKTRYVWGIRSRASQIIFHLSSERINRNSSGGKNIPVEGIEYKKANSCKKLQYMP